MGMEYRKINNIGIGGEIILYTITGKLQVATKYYILALVLSLACTLRVRLTK